MQVLVLAPGSRGDVAPAERIGAGLVSDGHAVTRVAHANYAELVAGAGCTHAPFSPTRDTGDEAASGPGVRAYLAHLRVPAPYLPATAWVHRELGLPRDQPGAARKRRMRAGVPVHHGISEIEADTGAAEMLRRFVSGTRHRVLVQGGGWDEVAESSGGRVCVAGDVPHAWLLPRTAAAVHQAGGGVTAACLRAGVPSAPLPQHTDQYFWARRATALGAAVPAGRRRSTPPESLEQAVATAVGTSGICRAARSVTAALGDAESTLPLRSWVERVDG